jgi:hypothetical protein
MALNASFRSNNPNERKVSNLSYSLFFFEGRECHSIEGWYQGTKRSGDDIQDHIFKTSGIYAKNFSKPTNYIYWNSEKIKAGSQSHWDLIFQAQICKYTQDKEAKEALLSSGNSSITHKVGRDSALYPAKIYCQHLAKIRTMLQNGKL